MTRFLEVREKTHGRRILVNLAFVEAVTDDNDGIAKIVIYKASEDDWDEGCIETTHSYDEIAQAILGGRGKV